MTASEHKEHQEHQRFCGPCVLSRLFNATESLKMLKANVERQLDNSQVTK